MIRWLSNSLHSATYALCALLIASPLQAQESIGVSDTPAIAVLEMSAPTSGVIGLADTAESGLPDDLWKDYSHEAFVQSLRQISAGIHSSAVRSLVLRALLTRTETPDGQKDLIAERAEALLRMGQAIPAEKLLAAVPEGYRKKRQEELLFLFSVIHGTQKQENICKEAADHLAASPRAFWQRWVILCQAKAGETDKAQLGLSLLGEQQQDSEFYQKIVQALLTKKQAGKLPQAVYLEHVAWLYFAGQKQYLSTLKPPPLAYAALHKDQWKDLTAQYGLLPSPNLTPPAEESVTPSLAYLKIPEQGATNKDKRLAFLAYGLRKAFGQPVSLEIEQELTAQIYETPQIVTSPSWRENVREAAENGEAGKVILLLASTLHRPLADYAVADIVLAVTALQRLGLTTDAAALAKEALK